MKKTSRRGAKTQRAQRLLYARSAYHSYLFLKIKDEMEETQFENYAPTSASFAPANQRFDAPLREKFSNHCYLNKVLRTLNAQGDFYE